MDEPDTANDGGVKVESRITEGCASHVALGDEADMLSEYSALPCTTRTITFVWARYKHKTNASPSIWYPGTELET